MSGLLALAALAVVAIVWGTLAARRERRRRAPVRHVCTRVIPNTFLACGAGGNYCSSACELQHVAARLNEDELEPVLVIARRMLHGRNQYGALDVRTDPRDWMREATEESADRFVYGVLYEMKAREGR